MAVLAGTLVGAGGSALGQPQEQQAYRLKVDAVAYYLPGKTALGVPVRKGVVAVDPKLIPLGTKLHVPGYGPALAADVGLRDQGARSSTSGSRARRRRASGAAAPSRSRSIASRPRRRRRALHSALVRRTTCPRRDTRRRAPSPPRRPRRRRRGTSRPRGDARERAPRSGDRPANAAAIAVDLRTGQTVFSSNAWTLAPAGLGREASRLVRSAARARPALSLPHRGRRRRGARRDALERKPLARRLRRPDARSRGPRPARTQVRGHRYPAHRGTRVRRRHALRRAARRARLEAELPRDRVEAARGALRGRRARSRASTVRPWLPLARTSDALERRGIAVDRPRRGRGRLLPVALSIVFDLSEPLANDRARAERRERQLRRRDGAEGARSDRASDVARPRQARGSSARRSPRLAFRSPECASPTARGCRASTDSPSSALAAILRVGAADPAIRDAFVASLAVAGSPERWSDAWTSGRPGAGDRQDGHDQSRVRARRVRAPALRLRDPAERLARAVLDGAGSAGSFS